MGGKGGQERGGEGEERGGGEGKGRKGPPTFWVRFTPLAGRVTHSLTAALDQLRVVASSTSNDPGRKGIRRKIPWVASVKELWSSRSSCFCQLFPMGSPWYYTREVY